MAASPAAETPDDGLASIVDQIAQGREAGAELTFRERRQSGLIDGELEVSGTLWRNERGHLVRRTTEPDRETQTLTADRVIIEREGRSTRRFGLHRAPELAALRHALTALLAGDLDALDEHFTSSLSQSDDGWRIDLQPRDEALAERVERLSLSGRDGTIERFVLSLVEGETIITELGERP